MLKEKLQEATDDANAIADKIQAKGWILYVVAGIAILAVIALLG